MIKKTTTLLLAGTTLVVGLEGWAPARSTTALTGRASFDSDRACFAFSSTSGAVVSSCAADFIVPLTTDHSGTKSVRYTSRRVTSDGQPALCRAVANDPYGTALSASTFQHIPLSDEYLGQTTGEVVVPHMGVFFMDCIMRDTARLNQFDYVD